MKTTEFDLCNTLLDASSRYADEADKEELLNEIKAIATSYVTLDKPLTEDAIVAFAEAARMDDGSVFDEQYSDDTLSIHTNYGDVKLELDYQYGKAEFRDKDKVITVEYTRDFHTDHYKISVKNDKNKESEIFFKAKYAGSNVDVRRDAKEIVKAILDGVDEKLLKDAIKLHYEGVSFDMGEDWGPGRTYPWISKAIEELTADEKQNEQEMDFHKTKDEIEHFSKIDRENLTVNNPDKPDKKPRLTDEELDALFADSIVTEKMLEAFDKPYEEHTEHKNGNDLLTWDEIEESIDNLEDINEDNGTGTPKPPVQGDGELDDNLEP